MSSISADAASQVIHTHWPLSPSSLILVHNSGSKQAHRAYGTLVPQRRLEISVALQTNIDRNDFHFSLYRANIHGRLTPMSIE